MVAAPAGRAATMLLSTSAKQLTRAATARTQLLQAAAASQALVAQRRTYATPSGPPPKGFRLQPPTEWDQEKEGTFNRIGKYFLLTEMARGMYVLMEQFFRPP